jgi:hypothetical protein
MRNAFTLLKRCGVRKRDKAFYLASIGWIILDAASDVGVIVRQ